MIDQEQLVAALQRLDVREREVLHLSLHRRVPDADLGEVLRCDAQDVARRRAAAIDRLAEELDVQRGEDLGHMLKALLEADTWAPVEAADAQTAAHADELEPADAEPETEPAKVATTAQPVVAELPGNGTAAAKPVLEMLTPGPTDADEPREPSRAAGWILAGTLAAAALIAAAGFAGASLFGGNDDSSSGGKGISEERHFTAKGVGPLAAPFPSQPQSACYTTAYIRRGQTLYRSPGGRRLIRIPARTEWKSPRVLSVVRQSGDWLAVEAAELKNGQIGWLQRNRARLDCVRWSLKVDLSKRKLFVRRAGRTVRRVTIAVGGPGHPTPTGRFAVTDRLDVVDKGSPYGCCVLALSGHQRKLPPDWPGGDRLAIHATNDVASIGKAVSLGCMRAASKQARWLIETIPLGTPVFIRS